MKITAFSDGCGALVSDMQLATIEDDALPALRQAAAQHGVLFFRDQDLPPEAHHRFATRFGEIVLNKFFKPSDVHPDIAEVRKDADQTMNIGGGWHTDHSYDDEPAMGSLLVARELPSAGGDTRFAHLGRAYAALSPGLKEVLETLSALHSNKHLYGEEGFYRKTDLSRSLGGMDRVGDAVHPVVIRHPDSGEKILYINPGHTRGIVGWTEAESAPLLSFLYKHVDQPQFTCRFNWEPGSVALWDNRATWHFAENDYQGEARLMHRITLAGSALEPANPALSAAA